MAILWVPRAGEGVREWMSNRYAREFAAIEYKITPLKILTASILIFKKNPGLYRRTPVHWGLRHPDSREQRDKRSKLVMKDRSEYEDQERKGEGEEKRKGRNGCRRGGGEGRKRKWKLEREGK